MAWKSALIRPFANWSARRKRVASAHARERQEQWFTKLISKGRRTRFGTEHGFEQIRNHRDFCERVPVQDYEGIRPYIDLIKQGERDVLWPGRPRYFAKTSGTTSGVKYIPITTASIPNHIGSARNALFNYYALTGNGRFFDGKMIFLSGSPVLEDTGGIPTGRLSGIVNHLVPGWIRSNQMPSYDTNCIEDWETKVDRIVSETLGEDMRLISGIPPWVQMYYERLLEASGKSTVSEIFPNYQLFVHGGVNYKPYAQQLEELVGRDIDTLETYPASEGFIAYQDRWPSEGLRLNVDSGIFYEFIPQEEVGAESPRRLTLHEVETDQDYALVINSNAGLWGYNIGDLVRFVSLAPPRLIVSGRVKHFISAFGEHVIGKEVDDAMASTCNELGVQVAEFTVAPQIHPGDQGPPYHEWLVEFDTTPADLSLFAQRVNQAMVDQNIYYRDLIEGKILRPAHITPIRPGGFHAYLSAEGKLGGQNKVPRLMNTREVADGLQAFRLDPSHG
ncbi:MAG: GH3 auxin-responsive promoter family protein [Saprospiraceae bacterium]|nr:GH3 auxin-responsive promoter family protein [Saprospiraceae bacterium]